MDDIAGDQEFRLDVLPFAVALDARLEREPLLQERDGIVGLEFLPEADAGIDEQHRQNDGEVVPMAERAGEHGRDLDHPGDRPPEEVREPLKRARRDVRPVRSRRIGPAAVRLLLRSARSRQLRLERCLGDCALD